MSTTVQANPLYLNARTGIYTAWDLRRFMDSDPPGPGVEGFDSFHVIQRQAGANMSVDIGKTSVGLMQAWVRGSTRGGQGLYRVDNVDTSQSTSDAYLGQLNLAISSNASGNPRIDQVYLAVQDQQHAGASNAALIDVAVGTPTAAASLDNRNGVASLPASSILLADIIINSGDSSIPVGQIRDRRSYCLPGCVPALLVAAANQLNQVTFQPAPGVVINSAFAATQGTHDSFQTAALMYLPRRIVNAASIRWRYTQGSTANTGNYYMAIADSTGRAPSGAGTGIIAFSGVANASVEANVPLLAPVTFEPGWYYVWIGLGTATTGSTVRWLAADPTITTTSAGVGARNLAVRSSTGGTTPPATLLSMTDVATLTSAQASVGVPIITLAA